jgi:hypothetical protein
VSNYPYLLRPIVSDWMAGHLGVDPQQGRDGAVDAAVSGA